MSTMKWASLAAAGILAMTAAPTTMAAERQVDTDTRVQLAADEKSPATTSAPRGLPSLKTMEGKAGGLSARQLIGKEIKDAGGKAIGEVNSVVVGDNGEIRALVVGVGGFLGIGEHDVALKWDEVTASPGGKELKVAMTKDQLKAMPEYKYSDKRRKGEVHMDGVY